MNTVGERVEYAAKKKGMSLSAVAEAVGKSRAAAHRWRHGGGIHPDTLKKIAELLEVSAEWLETGKETAKTSALDTIDIDGATPISTMRKVPVISFVQAGNWNEVILDQTEDIEYVPCPAPCGPNTFSLRVEGESMLPKFQPGELIFVDPDKGYASGHFVVAQIDHESKATFKQYLETEDGPILKALNPDWHKKYIPLPEGSRIIGRVIAKMEML